MKNLKEITLSVLAVLLSALIVSAGDKAGKDPEKLVAELGASDYESRELAMKELLSLGYGAREAVADAMKADDPEIRERARELWKKMRWMLFPEAGTDIADFLKTIPGKRNDDKAWEPMIDKYKADLIFLLCEMSDDKKLSAFSMPGAKKLIEKSEPDAIAEKISSVKDQDLKKELTDFLISLPPENLGSEQSVKLIRILELLSLNEQACEFAKTAWLRWNKKEILSEIAKIADSDAMRDKIWSQASETLNAEKDKMSREHLLSFYAELACEMKTGVKFKPLLLGFKDGISDASSRETVVKALINMGMPDEASTMISGKKDIKSRYLQMIAIHNSGKKEEADGIWFKILASLSDEAECYSLGELMEQFKDSRAEEAWAKILEIGGEGKELTVYDSNAYFRLAPYYEKRKQYAKAATLYEKGLSNFKGALLLTRDDDGKAFSGKEAEEYLKNKIEQLKSMSETD